MSDESEPGSPALPPQESTPGTPAPAAPVPPPAVDPIKRGHTWGMLCHLSALAGYAGVPFGKILGPLITWLATKDKYPFAEEQGRESLNFQISMLIYTLGSLLMICLCFGIVLVVLLQILNLVFVIVAAIKASNGEHYRYPMTIRFLK